MRVAVGSVKGSPGATTFALALAVVWPRPVLLLEADPAGGDLGGRFGVVDHPGLASLVVAARHEDGPDLWRAHAHRLGVGADVVITPASGRRAHAAVAGLAAHTPSADVDVIVDAGRLSETSPAWSLAASSDVLLVVSAADIASLDHTAAVTGQHTEEQRMSVVLVGASQFPLTEVAGVLGVPVLVNVPTDRRTAAVLAGAARPSRGWTRFGVPAAARTAALELVPGAAPSTPSPRRAPRLRVPALSRGGAR